MNLRRHDNSDNHWNEKLGDSCTGGSWSYSCYRGIFVWDTNGTSHDTICSLDDHLQAPICQMNGYLTGGSFFNDIDNVPQPLGLFLVYVRTEYYPERLGHLGSSHSYIYHFTGRADSSVTHLLAASNWEWPEGALFAEILKHLYIQISSAVVGSTYSMGEPVRECAPSADT